MSTESNTTFTFISEDNVFHTFILFFDLTTALSRFAYAQPPFSKAQTTCLIVVVIVMVTYSLDTCTL